MAVFRAEAQNTAPQGRPLGCLPVGGAEGGRSGAIHNSTISPQVKLLRIQNTQQNHAPQRYTRSRRSFIFFGALGGGLAFGWRQIADARRQSHKMKSRSIITQTIAHNPVG